MNQVERDLLEGITNFMEKLKDGRVQQDDSSTDLENNNTTNVSSVDSNVDVEKGEWLWYGS